MGCNNTPAVEENPLNINPNLEDESQFKDFEEIGSKYRNNYYNNIIYYIITLEKYRRQNNRRRNKKNSSISLRNTL